MNSSSDKENLLKQVLWHDNDCLPLLGRAGPLDAGPVPVPGPMRTLVRKSHGMIRVDGDFESFLLLLRYIHEQDSLLRTRRVTRLDMYEKNHRE
jgi:hypothetical protein